MGEKNKSDMDKANVSPSLHSGAPTLNVTSLQLILKELEAKSIEADDKLSDLISNMETTRINLHLSNGRVKTNTQKVKDIEEFIENLKANGGGLGASADVEPVTVPEGTTLDINQLQWRRR